MQGGSGAKKLEIVIEYGDLTDRYSAGRRKSGREEGNSGG